MIMHFYNKKLNSIFHIFDAKHILFIFVFDICFYVFYTDKYVCVFSYVYLCSPDKEYKTFFVIISNFFSQFSDLLSFLIESRY